MAKFQDEQLLDCVRRTLDRIPGTPREQTVLRVSDLSKSFGGIKAVQNLSFDLKPGEIVGVIGPNGAGKSTLFNLICGFIGVDSGSVHFRGQDITNNKPYENARLGIGRSFQDLNVFPRLSALDNVMVALQSPNQDDGVLGIFSPKAVTWNKQNKASGIEFLDAVGLAGRSNELVENLSYADQKLLILARLLAMKSRLLLLDELAAGLDPQSMQSLARLIRKIPQSGVDICLVEHSLDFVRATVDRILFLDQGELIADGTTEEITRDAKLTQIYFGSLA
jgi:branched-chain amino acid transport system permease protein